MNFMCFIAVLKTEFIYTFKGDTEFLKQCSEDSGPGQVLGLVYHLEQPDTQLSNVKGLCSKLEEDFCKNIVHFCCR